MVLTNRQYRAMPTLRAASAVCGSQSVAAPCARAGSMAGQLRLASAIRSDLFASSFCPPRWPRPRVHGTRPLGRGLPSQNLLVEEWKIQHVWLVQMRCRRVGASWKLSQISASDLCFGSLVWPPGSPDAFLAQEHWLHGKKEKENNGTSWPSGLGL